MHDEPSWEGRARESADGLRSRPSTKDELERLREAAEDAAKARFARLRAEREEREADDN